MASSSGSTRIPQRDVTLPSSLEDLDDLDTNFVPGSSAHETPLAHQAKDQYEDAVLDEQNLPAIEDVEVPGGSDDASATAHCLRKYGDEDLTHPNWPRHKKHVFVLSFSGKPIYTRYGDEQKLSTFTASLSGFISFVEDTTDTLRCINAGDHKIVFLLKGPLFLVIVARTHEPISHLSRQLEYTHAQVISILTQSSVTKIFKARPTFDLRILLGGTDKILDCLMHTMDNDASYMLNAIHCLRMPSNARNALANILYNVHPDDLLFTILIAKHQLVNCLRPRRHVLNPQDLHIVMNFVNSSSSFRSSESWTPICLPNFNENAFLHGYVCFLTTDLCLVLLSTKMESFYKLSECKNAIWKEVTSNPEVIDTLNHALRNPHYSVGEIEIPSLLHFLYKSQSTNQFTAPKFEPPYTDRKERKRLFRLYQHVNNRVNALNRPHKVGFELYATFGPLESKPIAIKACNQLLRWIKMEENNLFILNSPVW